MKSLNYFKNKILEILTNKEKSERKEMNKAFSDLESSGSYIEKSVNGEYIEKSGMPIGTTSTYKDGTKWRKVAPNKWRKVYENESRGAKMSIAKLKAKVQKASTVDELYQIVMENINRFQDSNGKTLDIVTELRDAVNESKGKINAGKKTSAEQIKEINEKKAAETVNDNKAEMDKWSKLYSKYANDYHEGVGHWIAYAKQPGQDARGKASGKYNAIKNMIKMRETLKNEYGIDTPEIPDEIMEKYNQYLEARKNVPGYSFDGIEILSKMRVNKLTDYYDTLMKPIKDRYFAAKELTPKEPEKQLANEDYEKINSKVDEYMKKYSAGTSDITIAADHAIKKLGEKKLEEIAQSKLTPDDEFASRVKNSLSEKMKNGEDVDIDYYSSIVTWKHFVAKKEIELAKNRLNELKKINVEQENEVPVSESDMKEAESIIGRDVRNIINPEYSWSKSNARQNLKAKIEARVRNNPALARAMLVYIQNVQKESGKTVFTNNNEIWKKLPKLNENARNAQLSGESETKTGVTGNLYESDDGSITVVENKDWGRYQISFPGKPDYDTISKLKRNGFRWSPSTKTWVGYNTSNGERSLKNIAEELGLKSTTEVKKSFTDRVSDIMEKSRANLVKKQITDKNGHITTRWVNPNEEIQQQKSGKKEDVKDVKASEKKKEVENKKEENNGSTHAVGDIVVFKKDGKQINGKIKEVYANGCIITGSGKAQGIEYKVPHSDIKVLAKVNDKDEIRNFYDATGMTPDWRNGSDGMQPEQCDSIEGLISMAAQAQKSFSDYSDNVKEAFSSLNPMLLKRKELKSIDRIKEKLREDQKGNDEKGKNNILYDEKTDTYHCRTIRDTDGHTFCLKNIDDVATMFNYFKGDERIVRMKNNFANPSAVGYSDINMNIKLPNGTIAEIQLNTTANLVAKERYGHSLYEVYRSISSNPEYKDLSDLMASAQTKLYGLSNKYSKEGTFPDIPGGNPWAETYKFDEYAKVIRDDVSKAIPLFEKAKKAGVLNEKTVKHFESLIEYIK